MDILLAVVAFLLVLGPLIFVHEFGHFLAAKLTGVQVDEFGVFFPPRLVRLWQAAGRLWLDGRPIRVPGAFQLPPELQTGDAAELLAGDRGGQLELRALRVERKEAEKEAQKDAEKDAEEGQEADRPAPLTPGPGEMRLTGTLTRLARGTEYTLNTIPLGGFVRLGGDEDPSIVGGMSSAPKRVRFTVMVAGAAMNIVAAFVLLTAGYLTGWPQIDQTRPLSVDITAVQSGSPAEQAGVKAGDILVAVNGQPVKDVTVLQQVVESYTEAHPGEPLTLELQRDRQTVSVSLVPRVNPPAGQGKMGVEIAQEFATTLVRYSLPEALAQSATSVVNTVQIFFRIPVMVIERQLPVEAVRPVSPVGISQIGATVIKQSQDLGQIYPYLEFTAFVSIALAISNLLPLPGLDGGHLLFVLIEALRGRRIAPERETAIHLVGMAMIVVLMMVLVVQDLLFPLVRG